MAKRTIKAGATDQTVDIFVMNSSSTTGAGLTGLAYNTASLVCYYRKNATGSATALTLATQTVGGAHSDGGFVEIDATNMPGMYRLDLSDTIVATGPYVTVMLKGATNMAPVVLELELVAYNPFDGVRMGMTALPNAAADAAGGLPISDAGGLDMDSIKTDTAAILVDTGTTLDARIPAALVSGRMDVSVGAMAANVMTAAAAAADLTTELQSGLATASALSTVDANVSAILDDTGTDGVIVASIAANAVSASALATDAVSEIADGILNRDMSTGTDSGSASVRTMRQALRFLRNKWSISGTTLTVTKEDDTTASWTSEVTGTAGADPITASDPAS